MPALFSPSIIPLFTACLPPRPSIFSTPPSPSRCMMIAGTASIVPALATNAVNSAPSSPASRPSVAAMFASVADATPMAPKGPATAPATTIDGKVLATPLVALDMSGHQLFSWYGPAASAYAAPNRTSLSAMSPWPEMRYASDPIFDASCVNAALGLDIDDCSSRSFANSALSSNLACWLTFSGDTRRDPSLVRSYTFPCSPTYHTPTGKLSAGYFSVGFGNDP